MWIKKYHRFRQYLADGAVFIESVLNHGYCWLGSYYRIELVVDNRIISGFIRLSIHFISLSADSQWS